MMSTPHVPGATQRRSHGAIIRLSLALVLSACFAVTGAAAAPTSQATDPVAVVTALIDAINRNDHSAALALLDPAFTHVTDPDKPGAHVDTAAEFLKEPLPHAEAANLRETGPDTAEADVTLSQGSIPPVAHPFTLHVIFTVGNGRIIRIVDYVSPQTAQDLAALAPPPGSVMPATGANDPRTFAFLLILGLMCALVGARVRRTSVV